jgi:hypothetical protein
MRRAVAYMVGSFGVLVVACGSGAEVAGYAAPSQTEADGGLDASTPVQGCDPGVTAPCTCAGGATGTETCSETGVFSTCACASLPAQDAATPPAACGDGVCSAGETCTACPTDCGKCPACGLAPSCSVGVALPSQPTALDFTALSAPMPPPDGGVAAPSSSTCGGSQLRLRISRIEVQHQGQEVWLPTGTISGPSESYYCIVQASDGVEISGSGPDASTNGTVEVALTTPTAQIPDYGGADFAPSDSLFWGQTGPRLTQGNLTVTYSCFQQKSSGSSTWATVLQAGANAAGSLAGSGPYGWAFGAGSVGLAVAAAAAQAAEAQGDWHMFDVTQTIDASWFLELTNGRTWSFTQSGGNSAFHDPWGMTVYVESWGCANAIAAPQ